MPISTFLPSSMRGLSGGSFLRRTQSREPSSHDHPIPAQLPDQPTAPEPPKSHSESWAVFSSAGGKRRGEHHQSHVVFASTNDKRSQPQTSHPPLIFRTFPNGKQSQSQTDPPRFFSSSDEKRRAHSQTDPQMVLSSTHNRRAAKSQEHPQTVLPVDGKRATQSQTNPHRAILPMPNPGMPLPAGPNPPQRNPALAFPHAPFSPPRPIFYHHSAPTAPSIHTESKISDPETLLSKSTLRNIWSQCFDEVIYNDLPQYLIFTGDMQLYPRLKLRDVFLHPVRKKCLGLEDARRKKRAWGDKGLREYCKNEIKQLLKYAIFSHRWGSSEPTFQDMMSRARKLDNAPSDSGYMKLHQFCRTAKRDYGCDYVWSDTCCINKESSSELEEAIRSMYRWYSDAYICVVYLAQSSSVEDFTNEPWFTRAWTLQELLAPRRIRMYGKDWTPICPKEREEQGQGFPFPNDKRSWFMIEAVSNSTGIDIDSVRDFSSTSRYRSLAEKMMWASERHATRVEDTAYSLLGIFDVTMPIAYGEGEKAFARLLDAITQRSQDPTFFAWSGDPSQHSSALPFSPACYRTRVPFHRDALGNGEYNIGKLGVNAKLLVLQVGFVKQADGSYLLRPRDANLAQAMTITYRIPRYISDREFVYAVGVVNFRSSKNIGYVEAGARYFCIFMRDVSKYTHNINLGESTNVFVREQGAATLPTLLSSHTFELPLTDVCLLHRYHY